MKQSSNLEDKMQHFAYFAKCPPTLMFKFFGPFGNLIFNYFLEDRPMTGIKDKVTLRVHINIRKKYKNFMIYSIVSLGTILPQKRLFSPFLTR